MNKSPSQNKLLFLNSPVIDIDSVYYFKISNSVQTHIHTKQTTNKILISASLQE